MEKPNSQGSGGSRTAASPTGHRDGCCGPAEAQGGIRRAGERLASVSIANETDISCFSLNQSDHRAEPKLIHS